MSTSLYSTMHDRLLDTMEDNTTTYHTGHTSSMSHHDSLRQQENSVAGEMTKRKYEGNHKDENDIQDLRLTAYKADEVCIVFLSIFLFKYYVDVRYFRSHAQRGEFPMISTIANR